MMPPGTIALPAVEVGVGVGVHVAKFNTPVLMDAAHLPCR